MFYSLRSLLTSRCRCWTAAHAPSASTPPPSAPSTRSVGEVIRDGVIEVEHVEVVVLHVMAATSF
eukprot:7618441-Heterocapsa_arctica.AAC.1